MQRVLTLTVAGFMAIGSVTTDRAVAQEADPAVLYAVHAINGLDLEPPLESADATVDILITPPEADPPIDPICVADVSFGTVVGPAELPVPEADSEAPEYVVSVLADDPEAAEDCAETQLVLTSSTVSVTAFTGTVVLVAGLDIARQPFVEQFPIDASEPASGSRLSVIHAGVAPTATILIRDTATTETVALFSVDNGNASFPVTVEAGAYRVFLRIADPADPEALQTITSARLDVESGLVGVGVLAGSIERETATVLPVPIDTAP